MKKIVMLVLLSGLLTACGTPSVEDLIDDPELLAEVLQECSTKMVQGKGVDTDECKNAVEAQKQMLNNMIKGLLQ
ncbi:EexN family lipoprotein [Gilvimarinus polysaccharolyticus]|uniref:EexN family lipoprotein n=1 Tax=Gilvimarinus polysaccharolyticus TaxID=863921 RepID=UPI0006737C13|nr:EexN family lipoprotein [Gilvimarinus polysaccharolyticus]